MRIKCPYCPSIGADINRTYSTDLGQAKEAICTRCRRRFTLVTLIFPGLSPYKTKKRLEEGKIEAKLLPES